MVRFSKVKSTMSETTVTGEAPVSTAPGGGTFSALDCQGALHFDNTYDRDREREAYGDRRESRKIDRPQRDCVAEEDDRRGPRGWLVRSHDEGPRCNAIGEAEVHGQGACARGCGRSRLRSHHNSPDRREQRADYQRQARYSPPEFMKRPFGVLNILCPNDRSSSIRTSPSIRVGDP